MIVPNNFWASNQIDCTEHFQSLQLVLGLPLIDCRGGSKIFSKEGGGKISFVGLFYVEPNWFSELSQSIKKTYIWKNRPKKELLGSFWKILTYKLNFGILAPLENY